MNETSAYSFYHSYDMKNGYEGSAFELRRVIKANKKSVSARSTKKGTAQKNSFSVNKGKSAKARSVPNHGKRNVARMEKDLDLTGIWQTDTGGFYYIRQIGETVWWLGRSAIGESPRYENVFQGRAQVHSDGRIFITGKWADIPAGDTSRAGTLTLAVITDQSGNTVGLFTTAQTGGFPEHSWKPAQSGGLVEKEWTPYAREGAMTFGLKGEWNYSRKNRLMQTNDPDINDITGIYDCNDGGTYYIRQAGNDIWWFGEGEVTVGGNIIRFLNVFHGVRHVQPDGRIFITGEWADIPPGNTSGSGTLTLELLIRLPEEAPSPELTRINQTGGFSGSDWRVHGAP